LGDLLGKFSLFPPFVPVKPLKNKENLASRRTGLVSALVRASTGALLSDRKHGKSGMRSAGGALRGIEAKRRGRNRCCRSRLPLPTPGVCHGRSLESQQGRHKSVILYTFVQFNCTERRGNPAGGRPADPGAFTFRSFSARSPPTYLSIFTPNTPNPPFGGLKVLVLLAFAVGGSSPNAPSTPPTVRGADPRRGRMPLRWMASSCTATWSVDRKSSMFRL
jgi:hypothetical protein